MGRRNVEELVSRLILELEREGLGLGRYRCEHALYSVHRCVGSSHGIFPYVGAPGEYGRFGPLFENPESALNRLLRDRQNEGWELHTLLKHQGWVVVFKRYVPAEDPQE